MDYREALEISKKYPNCCPGTSRSRPYREKMKQYEYYQRLQRDNVENRSVVESSIEENTIEENRIQQDIKQNNL